MGDTAQEGFLLPVGLGVGGEGDDGSFGIAPAEAFDDPDAFDAQQVGIQNAGADQAMDEQRLAFFNARAVNDTVLFRAEGVADGLGEIWTKPEWCSSESWE